jgi:hypothetical protein
MAALGDAATGAPVDASERFHEEPIALPRAAARRAWLPCGPIADATAHKISKTAVPDAAIFAHDTLAVAAACFLACASPACLAHLGGLGGLM